MAREKLPSLAGRFWGESELALCRFLYLHPKGHDVCAELHSWCQEMCVVRLLDAWARFCRELILRSASGKPITAGGARLPLAPGVRTRADALQKLKRVYTQYPYEPRWIDAQACLKAANILGITNYAAISAGIGVTPSPLDDLRILRNFLAHRTERTAAEVLTVAKRIAILGAPKVIEILRDDSASPPTSRLQTWTRQLQIMSQIAVR